MVVMIIFAVSTEFESGAATQEIRPLPARRVLSETRLPAPDEEVLAMVRRPIWNMNA